MPDETVYTVIAGYLPTVGYKRDDFAMDSKHGTPPVTMPHGGVRYPGATLNYGFGLAKDGSIRKLSARIRGSIAWYEFSTSIKEVQSDMNNDEEMQETVTALAGSWYRGGGNFPNFNKERESDDLLQDVAADLGMRPWSNTEEIEGSEGFTSKKPRPEERDPRSSAYAGGAGEEWGAGVDTEATGRANAIDIYMRDREGNIIRLDVTERSLDDAKAHHGLGDWNERQQAGVTSMQLLAMNEADRMTTLETYFSGKVTDWNRPIDALVNAVGAFGSQEAQRTIRRLKAGDSRLGQMTQDMRNTLLEMRGGGSSMAGSAPGDPRGSYNQAQEMLRRGRRRMTLNRTETMKDHSQYENFQAAMVFALHALGNIVKNFTTPDQVRGEYYTGYQLGDQGAGQDYVVGVLHRVFGQGAQVFQFKPLRKGDVILANEARLSHHFMRNNWEGTVADQQLVLQTGARQQNLLDAASLLGYTHGAVETNTIYHMGQADKDETMKVIHSGSMIIAPEDINADIQNFIDTMVADTGGQASKSMHRFLQNKIRQVATLNRSGRKGNIDPRTNALGGPMMTSRLGSSIDLDALQAGNVEAGYYADWLALSGSMDLTPAQAMRGGSAFAYDMMGYGGMLGSSGARASMGAGYGSAGLFDDSILEGSFERSTMSEQFVTGGTISSMADGNTSQEQKDWALNHSGNALYVKDKNNAVSLDSHGSARMRFTGQQNTAAKQMLMRGLGSRAGAESRNSIGSFLATSDAAARGLGAAMARGSGWQQWAKGMGPENKYYAEGEYKSKSRKAGWGEAGVPQLWAAPYVSIYYPAKQARVAER